MNWNFGFPAYLMHEEGDYGVLVPGQRIESFVIQCYAPALLSRTSNHAKAAVLISGCAYEVNAEVLHVSAESYVIDFGLRAIGNQFEKIRELTEDVRHGDWVHGVVQLVIPLCVNLAPDELVATLRTSMQIESIFADETAFIECADEAGRRWFGRDTTRENFVQVASTERGHGEFILTCSNVRQGPA